MPIMWPFMFVFSLLVACDAKPPEKTVFDPQIQALKKARQTEDKVKESAERQREAVERIENYSP